MNDYEKNFFGYVYDGVLEEVLKYEKEGFDANIIDSIGFTPLHWSCMLSYVGSERLEIGKCLIRMGADVNRQRDSDQETPFILACESGYIPLIVYLVNHGADVNLGNGDNYPIHAIARKGDLGLLNLFVESGVDLHKIEPSSGLSVLEAAKSNEQYEFYDRVLELMK